MEPRSDRAERPCPTVFLPCHSLEDFPTWLDEGEADELLTAWVAAWHPGLIAAAGRQPRWASVDLPPPDDAPLVAIVPASCDERFAFQIDGRLVSPLDRHVRGIRDREELLAAAAGPDPPAAAWAEEFRALGLAVLLAELLARRMRSSTSLDDGFDAAVVAAARAAVDGRDDDVAAELAVCYGFLEASRCRYYPVDVWIVDLVLLAHSTLGEPLRRELDAGVPLGLVAPARLASVLATAHPESLAAVRTALAADRVSIASGGLGERPLDLCLPEEIADDFAAGLAAWEEHVGRPPATFAQLSGGSTALLPQLLAGLGVDSALWQRFDGTRLPDPGTGRIRWDGTGGGSVEALARPPLDARSARAVLELPGRLGDTMDHDHAAVLTFAHYAGTSGPWHALLRRIGGRSSLIGTFATPAAVFTATRAAGTAASFEPDAFPPTLPTAATAAGTADPVTAAWNEIRAGARASVAGAAALAPVLPSPPTAPPPPAVGPARRRAWWPRRQPEPLVLDNGLIRLEVHPGTGGLLSFRRPVDRSNRLSQQVAVRGTHPQPSGGWTSVEDRAWYSRMEAEAIVPGPTPAGLPGLEARGRLVDATGRPLARVTQAVALVPGRPLAILDLEVTPLAPLAGDPLEQHVACRFAWHENEDAEIRRGLHSQSIVTERTRFTAPYFVEVGPAATGDDPVAILTGGLPWHVRSSTHVLDTILACGGPAAAGAGPPIRRRIGVGIGLRDVSALAVAIAAAPIDGPLAEGSSAPGGLPAWVTAVSGTARLTVGHVDTAAGRVVRARVGLLETAGRAGEARIDWHADVARAAACDLRGEPRSDTPVAITDRSVVVFLRRYEWVLLDLDFA